MARAEKQEMIMPDNGPRSGKVVGDQKSPTTSWPSREPSACQVR